MATLPPVRRTLQRDTAYEAIRDAIVRGDFPPGAVVSIAAVAATIERYTPLIRRLERRQFSSARARRSARWHDELIAACAAGDADRAIEVTARIWRSLEDLADDPSAR